MNGNPDPNSAPAAWSVLPLIRVVPDYTTAATEPFDDVIGIYDDEIVLFRKRRRDQVPIEAGEVGGNSQLTLVKSRGKKTVVGWNEIERVLVSKPMERGSRLVGDVARGYELRFHFANGHVRPMFFPEREAESIIGVLRDRLRERVKEGVHPLPRVRLRTRLRPDFLLLGLLPFTFFAIAAVLLPLLVVEVIRLCLGICRRRGGRSNAGPLAKLTALSLGYGTFLFVVFSSGTATERALGFPPIVFTAGIVVLVLAGALMASWIFGQFIAICAARVNRTFDVLPGRPEGKLSRWQKLLQRHRQWLHTRPLSIICKALGVIAFILATIMLEQIEVDRKRRTNPARLPNEEEFEARSKKIEADLWNPNLIPYLGFILYIPATGLIYLGYRLGLRSADEILGPKAGPPTVYLRSFADDGRNDFNPKGTLATLLGLQVMDFLRFLGPLANVNPIRLLRLCVSTNADTAEEQLSQFFRKKGPFVAIGRPGDFLTPGGAARLYITHDQWQERVREWLAKADTIVLQPADTAGVWWEIEEVLRTVPQEKLLFCLVNYRGNQHGYEQFARRFGQLAGVRMPRLLGNRCFLWLEGGQVQFATPIMRWPFGWPVSGCAVDFEITLQRFLDRKQHQPDRAEELPKDELSWTFNAVAAVLVWLAAAVIPGVAIVSVLGNAWGRHRIDQASKSAVVEAQKTEFLDHHGSGYHWRLRSAWTKMDAPVGTKMFTLRQVANLLVLVTPPLSGEPTAEQFTELSRSAIHELASSLGTTPRVLEQRMISTNGNRWMQTVLEIDSKQPPLTLRYICRVTIDEHQGVVAAAWTAASLIPSLEGTLHEALDGLTPAPDHTSPSVATLRTARGSKPSAKDYTLKLDQGWKEVPATGRATQMFVRDSGSFLSVAVENVAGLRAGYADYAGQLLKSLQRTYPSCETLVSKPHLHNGKDEWLVIVQITEKGQQQLLMCLLVLESGRLFQVTGVSAQERSEVQWIEEALGNFRVNMVATDGPR